MGLKIVLILFCLISANSFFCNGYEIGLGRADCTGPIAEVTFMGYANPGQKGEGIHLRQYSRAFIINDNNKRIVFVSVDSLAISHDVKLEVIKRLQLKYGNLYTMENVMMSATHDHSAPGGHLVYMLYDISILGFVKQNYNVIIDGIFSSIERAHAKLQVGNIRLAKTEVYNASINRSPLAYLENPLEERNLYPGDTDKILTQMQFYNANHNLIGVFNWYSVHATSMNYSNHLVTSDNLGYASMLFEKEKNIGSLPGQGNFVGAFACSHSGDVSPNTDGPKCEISRRRCDNLASKCSKGEGDCFASGPGRDMFESTKIIATRIYEKASLLLKSSESENVDGEINFIHQYIDMPNRAVTTLNPLTNKVEKIQGCSPAMGVSFAAGTTDGTGLGIIKQGMNSSDNKLWNIFKKFLPKVLKEDIKCHAPKPILLPVGRIGIPYPWAPTILPTQILKIGKIVIIGAPGEFTTMSGRRIRRKVAEVFSKETEGKEVETILAGLTNTYSSYVATPEEYQIQRYEGASTMFGPHTLTLYIDQYQKLAKSLLKNETITAGPLPKRFIEKTITLQTNVVFDGHPLHEDFGYVNEQVNPQYKIGDIVKVSFVAGHPRNNLMQEKTFLAVEKTNDRKNWETIATDANWETIMQWERTSTVLGRSVVHITWEIKPENIQQNNNTFYRIKHFGYYKPIFGTPKAYEGSSAEFIIKNN